MEEPKPPQPGQKPDLPQEAPKGRRICAWCQKDMGPFEGEGDTHGICKECCKKVLEEEGLEPEKPI